MPKDETRPVDGWPWVADNLDSPSERLQTLYRNAGLSLHHAPSTAFHESCHAACHVIVESELRCVNIEPKELTERGYILGSTVADLETITDRQGLVTSLAGVFASILTEPDANLVDGMQNDIRHAVFYAVHGWGKPDGIMGGALGLELQQGQIWNLLEDHWNEACDLLGESANFQKVCVVANALLKHDRLNGQEVRNLMGAAPALPASIELSLQATLPVVRATGAALLGAKQFEDNHRELLKSNWTRLSPSSFPSGRL